MARLFDPLEKIIRPRLPIMQNRLSYVFVGLAIAVNGFLLALPLPIPASNTVPAWMALILILGLTEEDGLTMLVGLIITGAAVGALVLISLLIGFDAIAPAVRHHREHPEEPGWILWSLAHWPWLAAAGFVLLVYLANSKWADRIIAASRDQDRSR